MKFIPEIISMKFAVGVAIRKTLPLMLRKTPNKKESTLKAILLTLAISH
jgi:hypothetical protein